MKDKIKLLLSFILLITLLVLFSKDNVIENFFSSELKRPFVYVYDDKGNKVNILLVEFVFNEDKADDYKFYLENRDKYLFLGITSYLQFPNPVINKFDPYADPKHKAWKYDYKKMFDGWLYCFKNPDKYLLPDIPKALISESDFGDETVLKPDNKVKKIYDFMYSCPISFSDKNKTCEMDWTASNKNWKLAQKCINIMCNKFKIKGLLVGRHNCKLPKGCTNLMTTTKFIDWFKFIEKYNQSKFLFVPNINDASPRIITEALSSNIPILLNKNILGGWKYINEKTGEFFNNEKDFPKVLDKLLRKIENNEYEPRKYYIENYGIYNSGVKLLDFVKKNFSDKLKIDDDVKYLTIRFSKPGYKKANF